MNEWTNDWTRIQIRCDSMWYWSPNTFLMHQHITPFSTNFRCRVQMPHKTNEISFKFMTKLKIMKIVVVVGYGLQKLKQFEARKPFLVQQESFCLFFWYDDAYQFPMTQRLNSTVQIYNIQFNDKMHICNNNDLVFPINTAFSTLKCKLNEIVSKY